MCKDRHVKNIYYITRFDFKILRAHVFNTLKTVEAMKKTGLCHVVLVTSCHDFSKSEIEGIKTENELGAKPDIICLNSCGSLPFLRSSKYILLRYLSILCDNIYFCGYLLKNKHKIDVIYLRDHTLVGAILFNKFFLKKHIYFEAHYILVERIAQKITEVCVKFSSGVITITKALEDYYKDFNSIINTVFCTAIDSDYFSKFKKNCQELRKELGLPQDKIIIGYAGNLYRTGNNDSYGVEDIIHAMPYLDNKIIFVGIGKKGREVGEHERLAENLRVTDRVLFLPFVSRTILPKYLLSFDLLLIPAAGARPGNAPSKIFEYLASGKPIVAADTVAIKEVLKDKWNALLVEYKDPVAWQKAIMFLLNNKDLSNDMINRAREDSLKYTWRSRALSILNFVKYE